jgi:hypothetical protein
MQHSSHANAFAMRPLPLAICGPRTVFKSETNGLSRAGREVRGQPLPPFFFLTHALLLRMLLGVLGPQNPSLAQHLRGRAGDCPCQPDCLLRCSGGV